MRIFKLISRILVGTVFIFSGTVKAIDPLGTVYKLNDYFTAFHFSFLSHFSLIFAIILCSSEFIAGFSVLFNIRQKEGSWLVLILMMVFTPLTFILALTNPVSDCGCFGDAIKLTNWQTFFKNILLIIPAIYLFIKRNDGEKNLNRTKDLTTAAMVLTIFVAFIFYNLRYLPLIDFLPYKTGTHIKDKMVIPEGVPTDKYNTTFIYEKNGTQKEFTIDNYPAGDTSWKFVDQKSVLVSRGYVPPIHDFSFYSLDGIDRTPEILGSENYIMLMISKKLSEADPEKLEEGFSTGQFCIKNGVEFYILTSSGREEAQKYSRGMYICLGDETTLKSMVRSDPGYLLIRNGTIRGKWSWANLPGKATLLQLLNKP